MAAQPPGGRTPSPAKKRPGPHYKLSEIKEKGLFRLAMLGKPRAVFHVMTRVGLGAPEAEAFIREKLGSLSAGNYHSTVEMDWDPVVIADVYGVSDEHGGWYIKFYMEHGRVALVSCHEPEHNMTCCNGSEVLASP